jgi:hypothetical protein
VAAVFWLVCVAGVVAVLAVYKNTPAETAVNAGTDDSARASTTHWSGGRKGLLLFAHPKCPCTRATLGELDRILAQVRKAPAVLIVFTKPAGVGEDWEKTDTWDSAMRIPGAHVVVDDAGKEARRFGASASGQVFLFDETGRLLFRGGITAARGHSGDNSGESAVVALLNGTASSQRSSAVFGCALFGRAGV